MEFSRFLHTLRRRWAWVVSSLVIGTLLGFSVPMAMTPVYEARAQVFFSIDGASASDSSAYQDSQFALSRVKSYTLLIGSPDVLQPVIDELDLDTSVASLRGTVTATNPANSVFVTVTAQAGDPESAAAIANAAATQLGKFVSSLETPPGEDPSVRSIVTRPADPPASPSSPRRKLALALGVLGGLVAGIALAVARQQLDRSVRTAETLKVITGTGVLAQIPNDPRLALSPLLADGSPASAEMFRRLRANLRFVDVDNPPRSITITSSKASEGKSTIALFLAVSAARSGLRVCLVEADMRRPTLSARMGIDDTLGLSDTLSGAHSIDSMLVESAPDGPWVLPAGTPPPDPAALLSSQAMRALVHELSARFDLIIVDTPPLGPVVDAALVASLTDGVILTVRYGKTRIDDVQRSIDSLESSNAHLVGTVISRVRRSRQTTYGYEAARTQRTGKHDSSAGNDSPELEAPDTENPAATPAAAEKSTRPGTTVSRGGASG